MKIFLRNQQSHFAKLLEVLKKTEAMQFDRNSLKEKISTIEIQSPQKLADLDLRFLFDYEIFPSKILIFYNQWQAENRNMQVGDTILQQAFLPPFKGFSQKVIFGVRVCELINEAKRKGFSYITLNGHAEKGISTFTLEQENDQLIFKIHTFSAPGNLLTRLVAPIFTRPYQTYCTKLALKKVKSTLENRV